MMALRGCVAVPVLIFMSNLLVLGSTKVLAADGARLVFGSFAQESNALAWAERLGQRLDRDDLAVVLAQTSAGLRYRVLTAPLNPVALTRLQATAARRGLLSWVLRPSLPLRADEERLVSRDDKAVLQPAPLADENGSASGKGVSALDADADERGLVRPAPPVSFAERLPGDLRLGLALETRTFADPGAFGQAREHPSLSVVADWERRSEDGRHTFTVTGFYRVDGQDNERTHGDVREGFYRYVGNSFDLTLGVQQVFWGVSEFSHVVDIVNQTDLVENIDFEEKLGQPLVMLSLQRDWGLLELLLMPGFRTRTFAGEDGRLRFSLPVLDKDPSYASNAEDRRLDGAVRWSHYTGPLNFAVTHFSGTNRDPQFRLANRAGGLAIRPHYTTIDQTGLEAQWLAGDLNLRLELVSRSGDGGRYTAGNLGFEQTFVGLFGTRTDLGLVLEYLYDDRGGRATNTLFERDWALGTRFAFNDVGGTQALLGVVWDQDTRERAFSLEASRQLGADWLFGLEGRAFAGTARRSPTEELAGFLSGEAKSAFLIDDDYLQFELRRYF